MASPQDTLLVIANLPHRASAERLAEALIERRVAACVNLMAPAARSTPGRGAVEHAEEHPVFAKTPADRYDALQLAIRELHPYELPEIIAVRLDAGLPEYLTRVASETRSTA
jgi:periplasmic divalent cation tolerance protein